MPRLGLGIGVDKLKTFNREGLPNWVTAYWDGAANNSGSGTDSFIWTDLINGYEFSATSGTTPTVVNNTVYLGSHSNVVAASTGKIESLVANSQRPTFSSTYVLFFITDMIEWGTGNRWASPSGYLNWRGTTGGNRKAMLASGYTINREVTNLVYHIHVVNGTSHKLWCGPNNIKEAENQNDPSAYTTIQTIGFYFGGRYVGTNASSAAPFGLRAFGYAEYAPTDNEVRQLVAYLNSLI